MLDTVHFRIHDLRKHEGCVRYLQQREFGGISTFQKQVEVSERLKPLQDVIDNIPDREKRAALEREFKDFQISAVEGREWVKRTQSYNYWTDWKTGNSFESKYKGHLPSHHYKIAYAIDSNAGFIEFNLSIPKYLYTTNVFQFVPHFWDKGFSPVYNKSVASMTNIVFDRFRHFMVWFLDYHLNGHVDQYDVEIVRLDFCFNKMFSSRDEAMLYIADLRKVRKKFLKSTKIPASYHNGVYFVHDDYTFKIYHKGDEFRVHDKNELKKLYSVDQLERLQGFADRMVRYEMEARTGLMNTVFKKRVFRCESRKWKRGSRWFQQLRKNGWIKDHGVKIYANPPLCDADAVEYTREERKAITLTSNHKRLIRYGKFYFDKTFDFFMKSRSMMAEPSAVWSAEIETGEFTPVERQRFGRRMFKGLVNHFQFLMDQFSIVYQDDLRHRMGQIEALYSDDKSRSRELQYQTAEKKGVPVKDFRAVSFASVKSLLMLMKEHPLHELKSAMGERTFYRYKKFLEVYGLKDYAPINYVFKADETFECYYNNVEEVKRGIQFVQKTPF